MYRVLLVNDCKLENFIMRDMLISLGYEVIISNESNALSDAAKLNCNMIIANFIMKEQTGDMILQQVKDRYPETRCILSSNNDLKSENFKKESIDAFIRTPVTKENLEKAINGNGKALNKHKDQMKPSFCTYCGEKSDDSEQNAKFCKYCGGKYTF
jgi:response regulator RpfG family c-di-GMP phosphodiesterase